jgi:hypothetical protein
LSEFTPQQKGFDSRLQRELARLHLQKPIEVTVDPEDDEEMQMWQRKGAYPLHKVTRLGARASTMEDQFHESIVSYIIRLWLTLLYI